MYLLIAALLECWIFVKFVHPIVTLIVAAVYALWYFDGKEYTGERRWEGFRTLRVWRWVSPVEYVFPTQRTELRECAGKRLFVVTPAETPYPLIWGIGLHGGQLNLKHPTHYMLPPPYLWIPFLRDVLMWSGAVTYSMYSESKSQRSIMLNLLEYGRSVCYSPHTQLPIHVDIESAGLSGPTIPSSEILQFAIDNQLELIPVVVQNERERYRIITLPTWMAPMVEACIKWTDYAFPLCYWFRWYRSTRPPPVVIQFGAVMSSKIHTGVETLGKSLSENIKLIASAPPTAITKVVKRQVKPAD